MSEVGLSAAALEECYAFSQATMLAGASVPAVAEASAPSVACGALQAPSPSHAAVYSGGRRNTRGQGKLQPRRPRMSARNGIPFPARTRRRETAPPAAERLLPRTEKLRRTGRTWHPLAEASS